jgi:TonB family protein
MIPIENDPNPASTLFSSYSKARAAVSARPPLVELKIPVTIHCDRIIEGSDKREPFSETTKTVLVFSHGAFVRIATTLIPGQRVFLFNEKAQKEVVCQVVKSAPCGSASCLVELQFSQPTAGFWDLPIPVASPASVSAPPIAPAILETILTVPPAPAKAAAPNPVAPVPTFIAPGTATVTPPPLPVGKPAPTTPQSVASTDPASQSSIVPPAAAPLTPKISPPQVGTPPASPAIPPIHVALNLAISASSLLDFSKEVKALLAATMTAASKPVAPVPTLIAPGTSTVTPPPLPVVKPEHATPQSVVAANSVPQSSVAPPASAPFTPKISSAQAGTPPAFRAIPPSPVAPNPATPTSSLLDFPKEITAHFAGTNALGSTQVSPATSVPHPSPESFLSSVEQLMLQATRLQASLNSLHFSATLSVSPAQCAPPVTQRTEPPDAQAAKTVLEFALGEPNPVVNNESESFHPSHQEIPPSISVEPLSDVLVSSEESFDVLVDEELRRWQTDESDAQVLGKSPVQPDQVASARPKKALTLGLAASVLLALGAGTLYFRQNHSATTTPATAGALSAPSSPVSLLAKNSMRVPRHSASARALDPHVSDPFSRNSSFAQPAKKPVLGDVHLAAPVVNRGTNSQQIGDALPTIETDAVPVRVDPLTVVAFFRGEESAVPVPVGGDVKAAQLIQSVPPIYRPIAGRQFISGEVQIEALIDSSGNVAMVKALSGPAILRAAALVAVKQWKFSPALLDGQPAATHLTVTLRFRNQ